MNVLTYVHLRNIHRSTGAGRVARALTENMARTPDVRMHILADAGDYWRAAPQAVEPWTKFSYHLFASDTSAQQARWALTGSPDAAHYWPEADIVYCAGESYVPTRRQRLAVTLHDAAAFDEHAHQASYGLFKQRLKWRLLYSLLARRADLLHTVSQFSAERLGHLFPVLRSRLRVVHNAAPERFFAPVNFQGERFLDDSGLRNTPYILLPGGLHYRKNAETVLRTWPLLRQRLRDYRLIIAGHCEPHYLARAGELGCGAVMTGFVDDDVLCSLYHGARSVWFPSQYEGFGVPVLEAMACGAPVVASDCTAIPEVAGDAAILVPPRAVDRHVEALQTVCQDDALRNDLIARGRARAGKFRWRNSANQLLAHFRSLI